MKQLEKNEYQCESCKNVYERGWNIEEAMQESRELWGDLPQEELAEICDDCFNQFMKWYETQKEPNEKSS